MAELETHKQDDHEHEQHLITSQQTHTNLHQQTPLNNQNQIYQPPFYSPSLSFDRSQKSPPPPDSPNSSISSDHIKENPNSRSPSLSPLHSVQSIVAVPATNRHVHDQPEVVTKSEPDSEVGQPHKLPGRARAPRVKKAKVVKRVGLVLRFIEFVVCLASFSVMAADKNRGWALDSFYHYIEFRYAMTINVIGFAYSGLQGLDLLHQLTTGKNLVGTRVRYSFDFAIDQILAYLLVSASSSAFTRVDDWISNWGNDKFPAMASASVGVSFVAFAAFALSSLISGYILCTRNHT